MQDATYRLQGSAHKTILIVSASGRMLAQSARRAELTPVVIDLFGDSDTRELAAEVYFAKELTISALADALDSLYRRHACFGAVYGSGLEQTPESLVYLCNRVPVFGNTPDTFLRLHDKRDFFATLQRLGLAYPETQFVLPETPGPWLCKPHCGQGGAGIGFISQESEKIDPCLEGSVYWQRYVAGEPHSALFLADGANAQIVGFNRQWTTAIRGKQFAFSGVSNYANLPAAELRRLDAQLQLLTAEFSLAGLNSLDFIWDGRQTWILEINPRPPASLALYDACYDHGLLAAHLAACSRLMPALECLDRSFATYQILFAQCDCRIPIGILWPNWSADRPQSGSWIRAGQPICSIMARGVSTQQAMNLLRSREHFIFNLIHASNEYAIHSER